MTKKIIIADSGPLIAFGKIKRLSLLTETLGSIIVPAFVFNECVANPTQSGAKEITEARDKKLIQLHDNPAPNNHKHLFDILGEGEDNAIILAYQLKARVLIDEKLGRKTAQKMDLLIIGTAGVLLLAKKKKLIAKIAPLILQLKKSGYYLSEELVQAVLIRANESTHSN